MKNAGTSDTNQSNGAQRSPSKILLFVATCVVVPITVKIFPQFSLEEWKVLAGRAGSIAMIVGLVFVVLDHFGPKDWKKVVDVCFTGSFVLMVLFGISSAGLWLWTSPIAANARVSAVKIPAQWAKIPVNWRDGAALIVVALYLLIADNSEIRRLRRRRPASNL